MSTQNNTPENLEAGDMSSPHKSASVDALRKQLIDSLPEGDPTGWPSTEELIQLAKTARPIEDILQEIAASHGIKSPLPGD
jgi:hypothetical protein